MMLFRAASSGISELKNTEYTFHALSAELPRVRELPLRKSSCLRLHVPSKDSRERSQIKPNSVSSSNCNMSSPWEDPASGYCSTTFLASSIIPIASHPLKKVP